MGLSAGRGRGVFSMATSPWETLCLFVSLLWGSRGSELGEGARMMRDVQEGLQGVGTGKSRDCR